MEENKLIESKKILTDYMLELNRDIQSAEDWANTGADEEMYFALQTVLNELERYKRIKPVDLDGEYTLSIEEFLNVSDKLYELERNSISKQVIRDKIKELSKYRDLAKELIEHKIVVANSDSLNYGRAEAHDKDIQVLKELLGE